MYAVIWWAGGYEVGYWVKTVSGSCRDSAERTAASIVRGGRPARVIKASEAPPAEPPTDWDFFNLNWKEPSCGN